LTDTEGDSGTTPHTNLSALKMKGLEFELLLIRSCQWSWSENHKESVRCKEKEDHRNETW